MKGINAATFRPKKINISLFLTVLIFCCLLFMEERTEEEAACISLFMRLGALHDRLRNLQNDVERKVPNAEVIEDKIKSLIEMIENAIKELEDKLPPERGKIRKDISIFSQVNEAEHYLSSFSRQSTYDSDTLLQSLGQVENVWRVKIQTKVNEAIASAHS